ncbi:MAG: hypothetical protein VW879_17095 [Opitutae bacterium]
MSTLALGLDSEGGFDPSNLTSFNSFEMNVDAMNYGDSGMFSSQSGDLVSSFANDVFDNLGSLKQKGFEGFEDVVAGEVSLSDAIKSFGQPVMEPGPTGKMRAVAPSPAIGMLAGPLSGLGVIGGAANMAIQKQNAAIFKATGAGFFGEFKGMMVSRKPGSFQYSGNLSGISQEQMKNLEAVQKGFIPGTMTAETYEDGKWSNVGGAQDIVRTNDVFGLGGTYNAAGNWVDLSGQGYASNTQANLEGYAQAVNNSYFGGTANVTAEDIKNAQAQVQTQFSFLTGTTVKEGTLSFQEIMQDTIDDKLGMDSLTGDEDRTFAEQRAIDKMAETGQVPADLQSYIEQSVARQKAAYEKEQKEKEQKEKERKEKERQAAIEKAKAEQAKALADLQKQKGYDDKASEAQRDFDRYGGGPDGNYGAGGEDRTQDTGGSSPGDKSKWASGGRVGMQVGGEAGFAERPEFVGGNQSQPDKVSVADDQPRDVPEGTFVINAAAADFAGRDDIEKMIRKAYKKVGDIGQSGVSQEVQIAVSKGEVIIPPHIAKIIGYDRLNKINNRGKKEISRRQQASKGGFINR